jgi:DNA-binding PadR family transcriptional regulator
MVALGAHSGYDIRRSAERSLRFFWALSPPQIYAELARLEDAGLVTGSDDARGRRPRRAFATTRAGERALRTWLTHDDPAPLEIRDSEMLRLFFADALPPAEAAEQVALMRRRSEDALAHFEAEILPAADRTADAGFELPREVARFGVELHEFIAGWCERFERRLAER